MKRFSAREFALLCLPVAAIAGAAFWASRRGAPDDGKPKLSFRFEQPSAIRAFDGVKALVVAKVSPDKTHFLSSTDYCVSSSSQVWLDVKTPQGTKTWNRNATQAFAPDSFDELSGCDYYFFMKRVPEGELTLRLKGTRVSREQSAATKPALFPIRGQWKIDKSHIKSFDFSRPRVPEVKLRSITLSNSSGINLAVDAIFTLTGQDVDVNTPFETQLTMPWGWSNGSSSSSGSDPAQRSVSFFLVARPNSAGKISSLATVTGRVSADNRWPLAFKTEPFDFKTVVIGQQLKFKSWPAPLPPGAVTKN